MDRLAAEMGALDGTDKATASLKLAEKLKAIVKGAAVEEDADGAEVEAEIEAEAATEAE